MVRVSLPLKNIDKGILCIARSLFTYDYKAIFLIEAKILDNDETHCSQHINRFNSRKYLHPFLPM